MEFTQWESKHMMNNIEQWFRDSEWIGCDERVWNRYSGNIRDQQAMESGEQVEMPNDDGYHVHKLENGILLGRGSIRLQLSTMRQYVDSSREWSRQGPRHRDRQVGEILL